MATSVFHLLHANSNDQRRFVSDSRSRRRPECLENTGSSSPGQRRYRNSFHRCSTFPGENLLLPGFSPTTATRRFTASITICHHRAVPECVPASLPVARCPLLVRHAPRATKHRHDRYSDLHRPPLSRYSFLFPIAVKFRGMLDYWSWLVALVSYRVVS